MSRQSGAAVAALAVCACPLQGQAFAPVLRGPDAPQPPALRGGGVDAAGAAEGGVPSSGPAVLGFVGAVALLASAHRRDAAPRIARRAEPVSVAAAGAAAAAKVAAAGKAAGAAAGAAKTAGAVAGSAGTGTMVQSAAENEDEALLGRKFFPQDRGTPEYEAAMKALRKKKESAWEVRTRRNPDGTFGDKPLGDAKKGDSYDPLMANEANWLDEAQAAGLYSGEFDPAFQVGVTEPLGFFDPLGFCKKGDKVGFSNLRAAEVKHGRVAMMAALGAVVQHYVQFPGFEGVPKGLGAVNAPPGSYGAIALFIAAGALELLVWKEDPDREPGNFGDPVGFDQYTEENRNRELNNGRFAMFAALGIMAAELATGKDAIEQFAGK